MTFRREEVDNFLALFNEVKHLIRGSEGCRDLALWRDTFHNNTLFTYSIWDSQEFLDMYRHSQLFEDTWARTKSKFAGKPEAWSVEQLVGSFNNKSE